MKIIVSNCQCRQGGNGSYRSMGIYTSLFARSTQSLNRLSYHQNGRLKLGSALILYSLHLQEVTWFK
jgi:hypothetical protein